ncbi:GNAT family N-acetyltransferase [Neobacillus mesonae]|nr:GNAT family N-acetyltransferase [Neobacillus mesonae]
MQSNLSIRICNADDLELLASLNGQLIEDEKHDNKMNIEQLRDRMKDFMDTDYAANIFEEKYGEVIGYALVNHSKQPIYLRHFFICRPQRRKGYGKLAFNKLIELLNTQNIDVEVMYWNKAGYDFWKALGFIERSVYLRLGD